jgi:hypothetical protein
MSWWSGVWRSVWSALSREVREHVGTDHLGNKYYYVAEYKNWRGESEERIPVDGCASRAGGGRRTWGPGLGCPGPCPGSQDLAVALGDEVWTRSCQRFWGASGKALRQCLALVFRSGLSAEFAVLGVAVSGALSLSVAVLVNPELSEYTDPF